MGKLPGNVKPLPTTTLISVFGLGVACFLSVRLKGGLPSDKSCGLTNNLTSTDRKKEIVHFDIRPKVTPSDQPVNHLLDVLTDKPVI